MESTTIIRALSQNVNLASSAILGKMILLSIIEGIGPSLQSLVHTRQILLCPVILEFSPKINPRAKMETIPLTIN